MKVDKLKKLLKEKNVVLIDIREKDEFEKARAKGKLIKGAKNVPMGAMFVKAKKGQLPKDKKIVTACKIGGRCQIVAKELKKKGYDIEYLEGGVDAWEGEK